jgi:hypothetical protein
VRKYEYEVKTFLAKNVDKQKDEIVAALNSMGKEGWRLASTTRDPAGMVTLYFEREN